jgi:hypothetical protein
MESNSMNEASFNPMKNSSKGLAVSNHEGNIITWHDYDVEEDNIDGSGYTDAITLFGKDKRGNSYTAIATMTYGVVDKETIEDIDMAMEESLNEAKEKKDLADKKKADKTNYGQRDIADVDMVNPYELKKGIRIEMESIEDYEKAMDKAVKKLKKDPMFYTNLIANAKETKGKRAKYEAT